jgi:hypothetical protein
LIELYQGCREKLDRHHLPVKRRRRIGRNFEKGRSRPGSNYFRAFIQQHPQLFGATHAGGFEAGGER